MHHLFVLYYRGLILFEDNAYILEPLEGATNEHIIYQARDLKLALGSCGHHPNISGITPEDTTQFIQKFASRVGGNCTFLLHAFKESDLGKSDIMSPYLGIKSVLKHIAAVHGKSREYWGKLIYFVHCAIAGKRFTSTVYFSIL